MFSATFAVNPASGRASWQAAFLCGDRAPRPRVEVLDLDEAAFRAGSVPPRLAGYLRVPFGRGPCRAARPYRHRGDDAALAGIAAQVMEQVPSGALCVLGPGTTVRGIAAAMGVPKTLTGVDVVRDGQLLAADVGEAVLVRFGLVEPLTIVLTPIGGQGFLLGVATPRSGRGCWST